MSATSPLDDLRASVLRAAGSLGAEPKAPPSFERPKQADHGDYATNAAMLLAGPLRSKPRDVAEQLASAVQSELGDQLSSVDVAGPGFLNLVLSDRWHLEALQDVLAAGSDFGRSQASPAHNVNVEFVSVNPTGPLHVGHARNAAYGDALARLLEAAGHAVHREYYVNDAGTQIDKFGESVQARARGEQPPEDGYVGAYVADVAARIPGSADLPLEELKPKAVAAMLEDIAATLGRFGVRMDTWFSEASLHAGAPSEVEHAFDVLRGQGRLFEQDGALWVRTTDLGDDRDRVVVRQSGEHTYYASDIAYHLDKLERGFDLLIDVWGADHHGYVARVLAAMEALGKDRSQLELLIMQLVSLTEDGVDVSMSKRAGKLVTLDDLVDEIGADAARWFLLSSSHDSPMKLDLGLASRQSSENPVYYVQYAHARIAGIRRKAQAEPAVDLALALHPSERVLVRKLLDFPAEVREAAERRAPHRVTTYALELAQAFTAFYRDCQVAGVPEEASRLALCVATQDVLAAALGLLGISAPQEMHRAEDEPA